MSAGNLRVKELIRDFSGPLVKENEEMILIDNSDGTATWFDKALIQGVHRNPHTGVVSFTGTDLCAVRNVRMA